MFVIYVVMYSLCSVVDCIRDSHFFAPTVHKEFDNYNSSLSRSLTGNNKDRQYLRTRCVLLICVVYKLATSFFLLVSDYLCY